MGSVDAARRAGARLAATAEAISRTTTKVRMMGSREVSLTQRVASLLNARLRIRPTSRPEPTLLAVEERTRRKTSAAFAPRARRMPNSLVRVATLYETTL